MNWTRIFAIIIVLAAACHGQTRHDEVTVITDRIPTTIMINTYCSESGCTVEAHEMTWHEAMERGKEVREWNKSADAFCQAYGMVKKNWRKLHRDYRTDCDGFYVIYMAGRDRHPEKTDVELHNEASCDMARAFAEWGLLTNEKANVACQAAITAKEIK